MYIDLRHVPVRKNVKKRIGGKYGKENNRIRYCTAFSGFK